MVVEEEKVAVEEEKDEEEEAEGGWGGEGARERARVTGRVRRRTLYSAGEY